MKQLSIFKMLLLTALFPTVLSAQWTPCNSGTTATLHDVFFLNKNYGAVVGDSSTILLTTDGGMTWQALTLPTKENLQSVEIVGIDTILVAAGTYFDGKVYLTTNGGTDWKLVAEGIDLAKSGNDFFALNSETILHSEDGGKTWDTTGIEIGNTTLLERLHFPKSSVGYAIGNISGFASYSTFAYRSVDEGQTWASLFTPDFPNANAYTAAAFPDADTAYIFTNRQVRFLPGPLNQLIKAYNFYFDSLQTQQWRFDSELVNDSLPTYIYDAQFLDNQTGYAVGENGNIYKTTSGGTDWSVDYAGTQPLEALFMLDSSVGYVVGANGKVLKFNSTTSTKTPSQIHALSFFPNPASGEIYLQGLDTEGAILTLFNPTGQIIQQIPLNGSSFIPLNYLSNGWYILHIRSGAQLYSGKVIVHK